MEITLIMKISITFIFLLLQASLFSQKWGYNTTSNFTNEAFDVQIDASQNVYTCGYITGETAFAVGQVESVALGNGDIIVTKLNANGTLVWHKKFGGTFSDRAYKLAIGPDQNSVVVGQFFGTVQFGATTLTSTSGSKDIFILKLDPAGNVIWARQEGGNLAENVYDVTIDHNNEVIVTGQFSGTSSIAGQTFTSEVNPVSAMPSFDFFIAKYTSAGTPIWAKQGAAEYEDRGLAIDVDATNNIYFAGQFSDTLVFDGTTHNNAGSNVGFYTKLSPSGSVVFFNYLRAGMVVPYDLEVNTDNEVIIVGDFLGNMNYVTNTLSSGISNPYDKQIFALKTTSSGAYLWNYTLGSTNEVSARSIAISPAEEIYITGYFKCQWSQMQETNTTLFNSVGFKDPYVLSLANNGTLLYNKQFGSKGNDQGWGIAIKTNSNPIVCGGFTNDLNIPISYSDPYTSSSTAQFFLNSLYQTTQFPNGTPEQIHDYLKGDSSLNAFVSNAVFSNTPDYNYFQVLPNVGLLYGEIEGDLTYYNPQDTTHFCPDSRVFYNTYTYSHSGPSYNFHWSNGLQIQLFYPNFSQDLSVVVNRNDACATDSDSVHLVYHPRPIFPLLVDDHNYNIGLPVFYNHIKMCAPDTAVLNFSVLDPEYSFNFTQVSYINSDSLGPITVSTNGYNGITLTSQYCVFTDSILITIDSPVAYDSISLGMRLRDSNTDTITICANTPVVFMGIDNITNPLGIVQYINEPYISQVWSVVNPVAQSLSNYSPHIAGYSSFATTGWYEIALDLTLGYSNFCGIDTTQYHVRDSFYIIVNPLPVIPLSPILGDNLLCPNGSLYLYVTNSDPQLHWSGPGIVWTSTDGDSVEITIAGHFTYGSSHYIDSITGCHSYGYVTRDILFKITPMITSISDIICPNDSVEISLPAIYSSYEWIDPNGVAISANNSTMAQDQGFYYCHVVDNEGCALTSSPFELNEYTTPSIYVSPTNVLCIGDVTTIAVNYNGNNALITWTNPLSPVNPESITVSQPGLYTCEINACGITTLQSVEILDGNFEVHLSVSDSVLCYQETAIITATPFNASYVWNDPSAFGMPLITSTAGNYWAEVTNEFGCTVMSDTLVVSVVQGSYPPMIQNAMICPGTNFTFEDTSSFVPNWYAMDSSFLAQSDLFATPNTSLPLNYLVAYPNAECPLVYTLLTVAIVAPLDNFSITGDTTICWNDTATFSTNAVGVNLQWQIDGANVFGATLPQFLYNSAAYSSPNTVSLMISNLCFDTVLQTNIQHIIPQNILFTNDSLYLCASELQLLSVVGNAIDSITWTGNFGNAYGDTILYDFNWGPGLVAVSGIDINGCATTNSIQLFQNAPIVYTLTVDSPDLCTGSLIAASVVSTADSLVWILPNQTIDSCAFQVNLTAINSGTYYLNQWDSQGCFFTDSIVVNALPLPVFDLNTDTLYCANEFLTSVNLSLGYTFEWTTLVGNATITDDDNQVLVLTSTGQNGCQFSDTITVLSGDCIEAVPNIITPNGDGINDYLYLGPTYNLKSSLLIILNRQGVEVYRMEGYNNTFDGNDLVSGVYFYLFYENYKENPKGFIQNFVHIQE